MASSKNTCVVASVVVLFEESKSRTFTWMWTVRPEYQPGERVGKAATPLASVTWYPRRKFCPAVLPTSEYSPPASQCQMSTCAPASGVQAPEEYAETANRRVSGRPGRGLGLARPLLSDRTSARL